MTTFAADVNESLQPVRDAYPDTGQLQALVTALMAPVEIVAQIARDLPDGTPAWQVLRDPDRTPAAFLPWLGQHVGEYFTAGATEQDRRDRIRDTPWIRRGKTSTMVARVKPTLTGTQTVRVFERVGGDQWAQTVITRTAETPDPTATEAAVRYRKPAGIVITYLTSDAPVIDDWTRTIDGVTVAIDAMTPADVT